MQCIINRIVKMTGMDNNRIFSRRGGFLKIVTEKEREGKWHATAYNMVLAR